LEELASMSKQRAHRSGAPRSITPMQRRLAPLDVDECLSRLAGHYLGRLAFEVDGKPQIIPFNYLLHEGAVVLRTELGTLLDTIVGRPVAFEVDEVDVEFHDGWSVVVHGRAEEVWEPEELDRLRQLPLRPWAPGDRAHYVRILSTAITGRRIT
jgi:uncharacterized protein